MVFPVVRYRCESWTINKAEHWKIDAFKLWYWRRLLRVPWTARKSNQSILREISPEYSLEGLMLKLKLQYFSHLMRRVDSLVNTLMLEGLGTGGEGDNRGWDGWMASLIQWTWVWVNSGSWWWTGGPGALRFIGSQKVGHDWATELSHQESPVCEQLCYFCDGKSQTWLKRLSSSSSTDLPEKSWLKKLLTIKQAFGEIFSVFL